MSPVLPSPIQPNFARVPHAPLPHGTAHVHPSVPVPPSVTEIAGKAAAQANQLKQPPLTKEQKTAGTLRSAKSWFMMPAQWEFFGMLGGGALGWVAKKFGWERVQTGIAMAARAPVQALRKTTLADAMRLPANLFKQAGAEAATIRGEGNGWTAAMDKRSDTWMERATGTTQEKMKVDPNAEIKGMEGRIAAHAKPGLNKIGTWLDNVEKTPFGKKVQTALNKFMGGRHKSASTKHATAIADAHEALTTESIGLWQRAKNKFTGATAGKPGAGALQSVADGLEAAKGLEAGAEKTAHFAGLVDKLDTLMRGDTLKGEIKTRAGDVMKHLQKAHGSAKALENYAEVVGKEVAGNTASLRTMASTLGKSLGRVPLFNALLAVGITAGIGAVLVTGHGESKEAKAALNKLNNELAGQPASGFLNAVKASQKSGNHWGAAKTGMRMAGEVAEGAMWMMPHAGMGMMGAMMLPQLCEMVVPGNSILGALEALDKNDKGQLALQPSDRIDLMRKIIGVVPSVAANGGEYNRGSRAMATEMEARGFKYGDLVKMLGNEAAFNKFANEVADKQQAQQAKIAAVPAEMRGPAANDGGLHAHEASKQPETGTVPAAMQTGAANDGVPKTRIGVGASAAQHQGMVNHLQRVRA